MAVGVSKLQDKSSAFTPKTGPPSQPVQSGAGAQQRRGGPAEGGLQGEPGPARLDGDSAGTSRGCSCSPSCWEETIASGNICHRDGGVGSAVQPPPGPGAAGVV